MGKFKDIYIKYLNMDKDLRDTINGYSNEFIYNENNNRLLIAQYILMSNKYIYEIKAIEGTVHLWTWSDFKYESGAKILSYKTEGNIILSQLMEFEKELELSVLNKYGLEVINRLN